MITPSGWAVGVTSGASMNITTGYCLSRHGGTNISWYQPIGEALSKNSLTLLTG